jgi:hypothetical protein
MFTEQSVFMNKQPLKTLLLTALIALPFFSQAKLPGILSRFQLGYSFLSNSAEYTSSLKANFLGIDTTYKPYDMSTTAAWGFTAGTYFPLKRMGNASALVLGVDYMYNLMTWKSKVPFGPEANFAFDGATVQMALPIGLDLKFGSDAVQTRTPRFCGTIGAGVYPSYAMTTLTGAPVTLDPTFAVAPYVKAEIGIFAGICAKVRLLYAIGDLAYMDYKNGSSSNGMTSEGTAKLVGKSNMAISLLIMPFSYKWQDENWWNTY